MLLSLSPYKFCFCCADAAAAAAAASYVGPYDIIFQAVKNDLFSCSK